MKLAPSNCAALTQLARDQGWLDHNDAIATLETAGQGNMNCVLRAHLRTGPDNSDTLIFKQSLPYVAKYPDIPAPLERLDVEADFYAVIATHSTLAARMPTIIGYHRDQHILCMQDLGETSDFIHLYEHSDGAQPAKQHQQALTTLLQWLSDLHNLSLTEQQARQFSNPAMRALNHEHIFVIPLLADNGIELSDALAHSAQALRSDKSLISHARELGEVYLGHATHASRDCLLHGDFYPGSWIDCGTQEAAEAKVIDPEFAFYGAPEFDVGVLLAHLRFAGFAQEHIEALLAHYTEPPGYSHALALQFAGMEIIRRLLGVAQLPLIDDDIIKQHWLEQARYLVVRP